YLKLAAGKHPDRLALQLLGSRQVHEPFDPAWSLEGYSGYDDTTSLPVFSDTLVPGFEHYNAADHKAVTDHQRLAAILTASGTRGTSRGTLTLGWLGTRTATTFRGVHEIPGEPIVARYDPRLTADPFHVIGGDDPLYRVSGSDVYTLRADADFA